MSLEVRTEWQLPKWTNVEAAYLAGIVDGEGCMSFHPRYNKQGYNITLNVTNTNYELIVWVALMFGLDGNADWRVATTRQDWKTWHVVGVSGVVKVEAILRRLLPYLRIKSRQAEVLISYCEWRGHLGYRNSSRPFNEQERRYCDSVFEEMRALNKKGKNRR